MKRILEFQGVDGGRMGVILWLQQTHDRNVNNKLLVSVYSCCPTNARNVACKTMVKENEALKTRGTSAVKGPVNNVV